MNSSIDHVQAPKIPEPRRLPLLGHASAIDPDAPLASMHALLRKHGPILRLELPTERFVLLGSRALVAEVCDEDRFEKHIHSAIRGLRPLGGDGLFTADTSDRNWGKAHRVLLPAFGPAAMHGYFDDMLDIAGQLMSKWERFGPEHRVDISDDMTRLTLDTIALCGFGARFNSFYQREMHPFIDAMLRALAEGGRRSVRLPLQTQLMLLTQQRFAGDVEFMFRVTDDLIARRRRSPEAGMTRDLLGLMLNARDPQTGETLDDANIRHQLVTFLVAGHETTSGLLSFAVHALLKNPDALARARAEVDQILGGETPRFEHLPRLGYIDQVLRETLRLYPTAPAFGVHARRDTTLGGRYDVRAGDVFLTIIPALHRDPEVWTDPERFEPARFAPAARERLPPKAWLPFGNGQRACIGRAFALQEATLVLAMMLQRFEIAEAEPYALRVKQTLTIKPEGLFLRVRPRRPASSVSAPTPAGASSGSPSSVSAAHDTPLLVLYGSNSGTAEGLARRIAGDGQARGYRATVRTLDQAAADLPKAGAVVIVTATYNGQPPDNARAFCAWLGGVPAGALRGVRFAVFGCGNRDWSETWQAVPRRLDDQLRAAGAEALAPRGEGDARGDLFGDFERWYAPLFSSIGQAFAVPADAPQQKTPLYQVEVVPSPSAELARQQRLALATVVANRELVDVSIARSNAERCSSMDGARSKRHLELALPPGMTYRAGDYLAVLPENHPELIERAARRFGLRPEDAVVLRSTRGAMAASLPTDRPVSLRELLGCHVELSSVATRGDLERLAQHEPCPPHRQRLLSLATDPARYQAEVLERRLSVLDILEDHPSCGLPLAAFLEMLPALRVRQYSISSSPLIDPTRCSLTVAVLDAPAQSGRGRFRGACSSYLARLAPGDRVAVAVRSPNTPFHPPADNGAPMVLVCAGTGLAPFRGFLQERAARQAAGEPAGPALLFFGCDHPDVDFLYRDELRALEAQGVVEVLPAFFKKPDGDITFVQHRLWRERARVRDLYERGASLFVCGDGARMAPAVRDTLSALHREASGCSEEESAAWLRDAERQGRYVADVFG